MPEILFRTKFRTNLDFWLLSYIIKYGISGWIRNRYDVHYKHMHELADSSIWVGIFSQTCVIDMNVTSKVTCYLLPIDCLLIAPVAHMFSHNGHGPGTRVHIHYG